MATYLYRLGGWAFEHRWKTLGMWLLVLVAVIGSAVAFKGTPTMSSRCRAPSRSRRRICCTRKSREPAASGPLVFEAPAGRS